MGENAKPRDPAEQSALMPGTVSGHRWDGWRRLTGDAGCFAACSCGWRSTEADCVGLMLRQVTEHLDAVRAVRGWRSSAQTGQAPAAGQREMRADERTRELYASVENQQGRLSQTLDHSAGLLSASGDQADRFVAVLEHAAARVAPEWARTEAAARSAEILQSRAERAKEWHKGIVAVAAAVAVMAKEVALSGQDLKTRDREVVAG